LTTALALVVVSGAALANSLTDYNNLTPAQQRAIDNNTSNGGGSLVRTVAYRRVDGKLVRVVVYRRVGGSGTTASKPNGGATSCHGSGCNGG
jgi:hypothetical protein